MLSLRSSQSISGGSFQIHFSPEQLKSLFQIGSRVGGDYQGAGAWLVAVPG